MSETKQQLIEDLKALLNEDATEIKEQVEHLKTQFYRGTSDEEAENAEENAALEQQFKELLSQYKAKRAEAAAKNAAEQSANMARKQQILDEMKTLAEGETDSVMSNLQRMRELQAEWKNIGAVPADKQSEMRKAYQQYQEQFYDMVKINIELRDLDFKKNLELKTLLCEAAERLINSDNIVEANRALQQLHDEWAEIGPVARELREDLWNRFKTASTAINKKHQDYFDQLHAKEQENFERKQAIIAELQQLNAGLPQEEGKPVSFRWDDATEKVQALQNEWRTIGFAPKKHNQAVYDQYRAECDRFFHAKTAYFKNVRDTMSENLAHKRSLVERAEQLAEQAQANTENDWLKETSCAHCRTNGRPSDLSHANTPTNSGNASPPLLTVSSRPNAMPHAKPKLPSEPKLLPKRAFRSTASATTCNRRLKPQRTIYSSLLPSPKLPTNWWTTCNAKSTT